LILLQRSESGGDGIAAEQASADVPHGSPISGGSVHGSGKQETPRTSPEELEGHFSDLSLHEGDQEGQADSALEWDLGKFLLREYCLDGRSSFC
jgi:hypothetical protein